MKKIVISKIENRFIERENMKKIYLVTYNITDKNLYKELEEELKKSENWWHYIENSWLILTQESPNEIWRRIEEKIDKKSTVLIIEVKKNCQGWLPKNAWDWIKEKFGEIDE